MKGGQCAPGAATTNAMPKTNHHEGEDQVDDVLPLEDDGRAREQPGNLAQPCQLAEGDDRARERHRADERADEQLDAIAGRNGIADAERHRVVDDRNGDEHGSEADERVHRGHEFGHLRHLHAMRDEPADDAAKGERADREIDALGDRERGEHGERHARDAEPVTAASRERVGKTLEGEDEEHARHEIGQRNLVCGHRHLRLLRAVLLLEHLEHPLGDQESAKGVDGHERDCNCAEDGAAVDWSGSGGQDGADDDDRADGVGNAHERRVQRRRHVPHHVVADEDGQHEHHQISDDWVDSDSVQRQLLTGAPSMQTSVAARISSDRLRVSSPVFGSSSRVVKFSRFRA